MKFLKLAAVLVVTMGATASAENARSPCEPPPQQPNEPNPSCSQPAAICVAYFKEAGTSTDLCAESKAECLQSGLWKGPNCVIINIRRQ